MTDRDRLSQLIELINGELRPGIDLESIDPYDPIRVHALPVPWQLLGTGNYAAVFLHPNFPDKAIKIYAPGRPGFEDEVEVYRRLGKHPAFSHCFYAADNLLILKRLEGVTLYNCLQHGLHIPEKIIQDIDRALDYAKSRGLNPRDVHGKNVMMHEEGYGLVVDISDFLNEDSGRVWEDLKTFYYWVYRPIVAPAKIRIPSSLLDFSRRTYRQLRGLLERGA